MLLSCNWLIMSHRDWGDVSNLYKTLFIIDHLYFTFLMLETLCCVVSWCLLILVQSCLLSFSKSKVHLDNVILLHDSLYWDPLCHIYVYICMYVCIKNSNWYRHLSQERERQFEIDIRRAKGYEVKKMMEDGNCLFRAVADQVYGDSEVYDLIRQMCIDYMVW